jgi:hypothetical protein
MRRISIPDEHEASPHMDERRVLTLQQVEEFTSFLRNAQQANLGTWQRDVHSPAPRPLWHYTTASGLEGILSSRSLWASDVQYMNDASELSYAEGLIADEVRNVFKAATDSRLEPFLSSFPTFANIFDYGGSGLSAPVFVKRKTFYPSGVDMRQVGRAIHSAWI